MLQEDSRLPELNRRSEKRKTTEKKEFIATRPPTPLFGDVGSGEIAADEKCYVDIEDILKR